MVLRCLLAGVVINALLSFNNVWPTLLVRPDARLAPEAVLVWVLLLAWTWLVGRGMRWVTASLATGVVVLALGRYWDVTVHAVFGREISLYWDVQEGRRLLGVAIEAAGDGTIFFAIVAAAFGLIGLFVLSVVAVRTLARNASAALSSRAAMIGTAFASGLVITNALGVQATWPYVSKPVVPVYIEQAKRVWTSLSSRRLANVLPASPAMTADLALLDSADVKMLFVESYGIATYDVADIRQVVDPARNQFAGAVAEHGLQLVSAFVTPPTFAGGSGLSHMSLLAGIDTSDPFHYHLLLASQRPTLLSAFRQRNYETIGVGLYSGRTPESSFYQFDYLYSAQDLQYRGPEIGIWKVPDQFAMARVAQWHPPAPAGPSRFVFFPTLASHLPFAPTPSVESDWQALIDQGTADTAHGMAAQAKVDWDNLAPSYSRALTYTFDWLTGFLDQDHPRGCVLILIGDHQPASSVSGPGAAWEVPIHIVTDNTAVVQQLLHAGFVRGITPARQPIARLHELTPVLVDAFSTPDQSAAKIPHTRVGPNG
ncbi:MAG: sulfatase-like hydrolase/transferase [Burkholderiaceae bacterium]